MLPRARQSKVPFQPVFLKPRYWGTWFLLLVLWLVMWLPRTWVMGIGKFVGDQMYKRNSKRRHIAEINISLCFPQLSKEQQREMVVEHFRSYGCSLVDMGLGMMGTRRRAEKYIDVTGEENLTGLLGARKIILVHYHTTTLDKGWHGFLPDLDVVSMMKRDKNPVINWFLFHARSRFKKAQLLLREEGLGEIVNGMQAGKLCYLIPDEDFGDGRHTVFAQFFGQPRSTLNIVSRLARITDAVVIPGICRLIPETGRYLTTFCPPLENYPTGDHVADAEKLHRAMEELILEAPEQYLWTFRWFRTQPGNSSDPYELPDRKNP